jgi:DNA-nicking Smr family endonuclease
VADRAAVKRPLKPEELRLWSLVTGTVHPLPGRRPEIPPPPDGEPVVPSRRPPAGPVRIDPGSRPPGPAVRTSGGESVDDRGIEPNRRHRIVKQREPIGGRLDLHGLTQDRARAVLEIFLRRAWDDGWRAVLVITGKGVQGDGVLRKRAPEWLGAPHLAHIVAGISEAHRRHGGEGALYVALKRKPRS